MSDKKSKKENPEEPLIDKSGEVLKNLFRKEKNRVFEKR